MAAQEAETGGSFLAINGLVIVVVVLVTLLWGILRRVYFQPLGQVLDERDQLTLGRLEEARALLRKIEQEQRRYEQAIREAYQYANQRMAETRVAAEQRRLAMVEQARQEMRVRIEQVRAELAREVEQAKRALEAEGERLAVEIVERLLRRSISVPSDQMERLRGELVRTD